MEQMTLGGLVNCMAAERSKEANFGTFCRPNSLDSIDRLDKMLALWRQLTAPVIGLTFLFKF